MIGSAINNFQLGLIWELSSIFSMRSTRKRIQTLGWRGVLCLISDCPEWYELLFLTRANPEG